MKRQWLKDYRHMAGDIRRMREIIADLDEICAPVAKWSEDGIVGGGEIVDKVGEVVAKRDAMMREYVEKLNVMLDRKKEIEEWIAGIKGQRQRAIVECLYVRGMTWLETVSELKIKSDTIAKNLRDILED